jgi:gliding motility-associated-like protein
MRVGLPLLLFTLFSVTVKSQVNLSAGLVAHYPFNGNVNDVSGNNYHGQILNGLQLTTDRFGNTNSAYLFDGIDDYIRVIDNGSFSTPKFSLVVWFQSHSDNLQNLVGKRDFTTVGGTAGAQYQFFINYQPFPGIGSNLVGNNSTCSNISSSSYINTNNWICRTKWYCAVVTFDGSRHKIYIDGVLKRDDPTAFNGFLDCNSDLRFGNWWQGDLIPFKGLMDDIRWYNRALNQAEVTALYANFSNISGQCSYTAGAGFLAPDTVCVNTPVQINNTSVGASNYYWNFCVANSTTNPAGVNLSGIGLNQPVFMDYAKDGNNYYGFVVNHLAGRLIRLDFGTSLLNTPTSTDLGAFGDVIPIQCEGIQVVKNGNNWYAIMVGGQPVGRILKIDFGSSLSNNTPTATNWGNIGSLAFPTDLHVFQDGSNWYGLTINAQTNTITRFNFTSSFNNVPTGVSLGNIGSLNYPTGIYAIFQNGNWYAFISNNGNGLNNSPDASITRLNFGNSLLNTPTGVNLGNPGNLLSSSRDLTIYQSCEEIFGFVVNNTSSRELIRLNFNNSLTSIPTGINLGNVGNLSFPHSISKLFRDGSDLYAFITNVDNNTMTRLRFSGCTNSSIATSTVQNPPPIIYNTTGTYSINLTVDDGLPTQSAYCKKVVVVQNTHAATQTKTLCSGDSVLLSSSKPSGNVWSTGSTNNSIYVKTAGTYWVQSSIGGCVNIDSFVVIVKPSPTVNLGIDTSLCSADSLILNAGNAGAAFTWQNGQTTQTFVVKQQGLYHVAVNLNGCLAKDSILISQLPSPAITLSNDTTVCKGSTTTLTASGGNSYTWFPTTGLTNSSGATTNARPDTTTKYYVTVTNQQNCTAKDSVIIAVKPNPTVNIGADTSLCTLDSLTLNAGNAGASYSWQNNQTTQTFVVKQGGVYHVTVNLNGCLAKDSVTITDLPSPVITLSPDTTICKPGAAILTASGGDVYSWFPSAGLSNNNGPTVAASPDTITTYHLTATNNDGCVAKDSVTVKPFATPTVNLGIDTSLCSLDSLVLNAGNSSSLFAWQNGQTTQTFTATQGGLYYVTVTRNGCMARDSILISDLTSPTVTISSDTTICRTAGATLTGDGGTHYSWWPSAGLSDTTSSSIVARPDATTTYYLVVTNADNCSAKDSVKVTVVPMPVFNVGSSKPVVCLGDTVLLTASGGDNYTWSPTASLSNPFNNITNAYPNIPTLYKVIIEHDGCNLTDSLFINLRVADRPAAALSKSNDINCFQGQATLTAAGGNRYLWYPSTGLSDSTSSTPVVSTNQSTTYYVLITTTDGCQVQDSITVYVEKGDDGNGFPVPSAFTPNGDGKNDCFSVKHWGRVKEFSLNLYNRWGERVFQAKEPSQCWNGYYKGVLQPGDVYVYWIKAKTMCGEIFRKGTFVLIR